jgi:hypothetical protein
MSSGQGLSVGTQGRSIWLTAVLIVSDGRFGFIQADLDLHFVSQAQVA